MTIRKSNETGQMMAQCDKCLDVVDFDEYFDFATVKIAIDTDKWTTKRQNGKWVNICPDCIK